MPPVLLGLYMLTLLVYGVLTFRTVPESAAALQQARPAPPASFWQLPCGVIPHTFEHSLREAFYAGYCQSQGRPCLSWSALDQPPDLPYLRMSTSYSKRAAELQEISLQLEHGQQQASDAAWFESLGKVSSRLAAMQSDMSRMQTKAAEPDSNKRIYGKGMVTKVCGSGSEDRAFSALQCMCRARDETPLQTQTFFIWKHEQSPASNAEACPACTLMHGEGSNHGPKSSLRAAQALRSPAQSFASGVYHEGSSAVSW